VIPVLYPAGLTRGIQVGLGIAVLMVNAAAYAAVARRMRRVRHGAAHADGDG
jgi:hypothetical protein